MFRGYLVAYDSSVNYSEGFPCLPLRMWRVDVSTMSFDHKHIRISCPDIYIIIRLRCKSYCAAWDISDETHQPRPAAAEVNSTRPGQNLTPKSIYRPEIARVARPIANLFHYSHSWRSLWQVMVDCKQQTYRYCCQIIMQKQLPELCRISREHESSTVILSCETDYLKRLCFIIIDSRQMINSMDPCEVFFGPHTSCNGKTVFLPECSNPLLL